MEGITQPSESTEGFHEEVDSKIRQIIEGENKMTLLLNHNSKIIMLWFYFATGLKSRSPIASWVLMNKECSY